MPRELVAVKKQTPVIREYEDKPLQPSQIRVATLYGTSKHGTEMHLFRDDSPFKDSHFDSEQRIFLPNTAEESGRNGFPFSLGNMAVGRVTEIGSEVEGLQVGDLVAGYGPLRETQTWEWDAPGPYPGVRKLASGMSWQAAVCLDPATVALGGVRDGGVRVGDRVSIFGLGAIGLAAIQIARIAGASFVAAIDPIAHRREVALNTGTDIALDPTETDAGLEIRHTTGGKGVDVALETSGSAQALQHSIRGLAYRGTVAVCAWYTEIRGGLDLGREAHFNRPTLIFPRAESEPHLDHPRWDNRRQADAAWELLAHGRLECAPIVQPLVSFDETPQAYREIDEHPENTIKLGVLFNGE